MDAQAATDAARRASVKAGAIVGLVGAVSFWAFHTMWISVVHAVLVEGALWGITAGAATGWAFHHLHVRAGFPADRRGGLMLAVTLWLLLAPFEIIGLALGPFTHLTRPAELLAIAPVGLLAAPIGALVGWAITHDRRAAVALAIACTLLHFMLGGSLVYFGGRGILLILFAWMLPTYVVAGLVFVKARAILIARSANARSTPMNPEVGP